MVEMDNLFEIPPKFFDISRCERVAPLNHPEPGRTYVAGMTLDHEGSALAIFDYHAKTQVALFGMMAPMGMKTVVNFFDAKLSLWEPLSITAARNSYNGAFLDYMGYEDAINVKPFVENKKSLDELYHMARHVLHAGAVKILGDVALIEALSKTLVIRKGERYGIIPDSNRDRSLLTAFSLGVVSLGPIRPLVEFV